MKTPFESPITKRMRKVIQNFDTWSVERRIDVLIKSGFLEEEDREKYIKKMKEYYGE